MIGLLGATGYTGRLTAAELARRGLPHRLGARNEGRLGRLPRVPGQERTLVDAGDPAALDRFLDGLTVVISTAGPFARVGLPVVAAAVRNGVPYVDSTGESGFIRDVYARFADAATPVVCACGFDFIPGDLAVAAAADALGDAAQEVEVVYEVAGFRPTRGTATSLLESATHYSLSPSTRTVRFPDREATAIQVSWGEALTVPRHQPGADVWIGAVVPSYLAGVAPAGVRLFQRAAPLLARAASHLPEGPSPAARQRARFRILATARAGARSESVLVSGRDAYGLTARLLVEAALSVTGQGPLTPAQGLGDAAAFLDRVTDADFSWRRLASPPATTPRRTVSGTPAKAGVPTG